LPPGIALPQPIKARLNRLFPDGWSCNSLKKVRGYYILCVDTSDYLQDVVMLDRRLRVCIKAEGRFVASADSCRINDLTGDGRVEVILETYSGGGHCCTDYYVCALSPFRLLAAIEAGNSGIIEITDLNHDGTKEIILADDSFADFDDIVYADSPRIPMVLAYRQGRYVAASAQFPSVIRKDIQDAKQILAKADPRKACEHPELPESTYQAAILQWFADSVILGEAERTMQEIRCTAAPCAVKWLERHRQKIVEIVHRRGHKISYALPRDY